MLRKVLRQHNELVAGLRERKKAKTRATIQQEALRLFRERGYENTTVEQIAEAAEVSPSTFFRYFPSKEDAVLYDVLDPLFIQAFQAQPPELSPLQALRAAFHAVLSRLPADQLVQQRQRTALFLAVPDLRATWLDQLMTGHQMLAQLVADRIGRPADDFVVRNFAGAVFGVCLTAMLRAAEDPKSDVFALLDPAFAHLEAGLPL